MTDLFYNTPGEKGEELKASKAKVRSQEEQILRLFDNDIEFRSHLGFTPSQVWIYIRIGQPKTPITSIRRAITNLTKAGKLVKTDKQVKGPYGHKEYLWKLAEKEQGNVIL